MAIRCWFQRFCAGSSEPVSRTVRYFGAFSPARTLSSGAASGLRSPLQQLARSQVMLRREDLGRRHQRRLVAVLNRDQHRLHRDDRLAGADIALQQPAHGFGAAHVFGDLRQRPLLRASGMERQHVAQGFADGIARREGDAALLARLAPLQLEPQLQKEKLFKDKSLLCGGAGAREQAHGRAHRREVDLAQRACAARQLEPGQHSLGQRLRNDARSRLRRLLRIDFRQRGRSHLRPRIAQLCQHRVHHPAQPAGMQPLAAQRFVNGGDAPHLQQFALRCFGGLLRQQLHLRLNHLEPGTRARRLHLAVDHHPLARLVLVLQVCAVEPHALQRPQVLPHRQLEDRHAPSMQQRRPAHLPDDAGHLARF